MSWWRRKRRRRKRTLFGMRCEREFGDWMGKLMPAEVVEGR